MNCNPKKAAGLRIGIFGAGRGSNYYDLFRENEQIEVAAVCDKSPARTAGIEKQGTPVFRSFDEFLAEGKKMGMNAVFLANYFHEHAPFAVRAMEAGMDVISECTAAGTLADCVSLCEAVERTGRKYMLAENYPFMIDLLKMGEIVKSGKLGGLLYAEGEYNHSSGPEETRSLAPDPYHWRIWRPRTYYNTHSLGPVMYMTDSVPVYISGRTAHSDLIYGQREFRHNYDGAGMIFCEMSNGMMARITGCTEMGSDYSRYRVCGELGGVEAGGYTDGIRLFYNGWAVPEGCGQVQKVPAEFDNPTLQAQAEKARTAGHGGGDFFVVETMVDYFLYDKKPFFDVYKGVAMSAAGILGWISALNHGENMKIPDFRNKEEREAFRNDRRTPFPDENGNGITLPCARPDWPGKRD